jgi:hypothetical protein
VITYQPVLSAVNINGRTESKLDIYRVDSQLSSLTSVVNKLVDANESINDLNTMLIRDVTEFDNFMKFYFSTMPNMRRAFNEWKIAQQTKERILDGHSND